MEDISKNASDPRLECLEELVPELAESERLIIQKIFYEGISQTDVAVELGKSKQAVNKQLKRLYARIRKLF